MQYIHHREGRQRGTVDFPLEYHHVTPAHPRYIMSMHWHVEFEIMRIISGNLELTLVDQSYLVPEGSVVLVSTGVLHAAVPTSCVYECAVFDINMLLNKSDPSRKLMNRIINNEIKPFPVFPPDYDDIHQTGWTFFDALASGDEGHQLIALGSLYLLFGILFHKKYYHPICDAIPKSHKRILQLKAALEYIESSFSSPISLADMAGSVHMSPKYFCRFFKEMMHRTPIDYLNHYRIEKACYQLLVSDDSITDIAFSCGFNDLSYFFKTFKRYKGITPKQYLNPKNS